jgi:hypothetical protein
MAVTKQRKPETAAEVILGVLVYEFDSHDRAEAETKIKKRLRYYKLGPYTQAEVDLLRRLKDSLQKEIGNYRESKYYMGSHGKWAAMEDFDTRRLIADYSAMFPGVSPKELEWFVPFAVFTYYLR